MFRCLRISIFWIDLDFSDIALEYIDNMFEN